jgi:hypothetical protein
MHVHEVRGGCRVIRYTFLEGGKARPFLPSSKPKSSSSAKPKFCPPAQMRLRCFLNRPCARTHFMLHGVPQDCADSHSFWDSQRPGRGRSQLGPSNFRLGPQVVFEGSLSGAWAASSFCCPDAPPMQLAGAFIVWRLPLTWRCGHAKDGEGWVLKVQAFCWVRHGCWVSRPGRPATTGAPQNLPLNPLIDPATLRACSSHLANTLP